MFFWSQKSVEIGVLKSWQIHINYLAVVNRKTYSASSKDKA